MKIKVNIFVLILSVLMLFAAVPIIILTNQSLSSLDRSRELSKGTIETTVKDQTIQLYKAHAENMAKRISEFLLLCENDLRDFSSLPRNQELYLNFARNNSKWVNFLNDYRPLYKEIALIDKEGNETIKIVDNKLLEKNLLRDVSKPENTTYLAEEYFNETRSSLSDIYISNLQSWYISRFEQLEQGKTLDGVIRFCIKLKNTSGEFNGICMIALDAVHLLDFVEFKITPKEYLVDKYKTGSYTYLIDEDGWIIAHQKLWDIKGYNRDGKLVEALNEFTPKWKWETGIIPINLFNMDWRLRDHYTKEPMSSIINRVKRGESVITTVKSMGIYKEVDGIIRTRAYAPIHYPMGSFRNQGIFGIVSVGTSLKTFNDNTRLLAAQLEEINNDSKQRMIYITILIGAAAFIFSFFFAKWITKPIHGLTAALSDIGKGNYKVNKINTPIEEVKILSNVVNQLAEELKEKENKININVTELKLVNEKLAKAEKELSAYWQHEYEAETDIMLEERIKFYEKEYPILKELRKEVYIGNSTAYLRMLRLVLPQSRMNMPTWLYGESGVGKSSLAYVIHSLSPRAKGPFQVFGASEFAASDPMIILGKLFGYGPGHGLTGIDKNGQPGILEQCNGGTLLIDDVESLPLDTQSQILRVVDGLAFHHAAGRSDSISVDIRFLFASNVNLEQNVKEGSFRKDLYRRIGGSFNKIEIPPLRNRKQDIPLLTDYFIKQYNNRHNVLLNISREALNLLMNHDYCEGNIAELKVLIEIACENARIEGSKILTTKQFISISENLRENNYSPGDILFNDHEREKLSVLRENYFRVNLSEEILGFKPGSHTLSHYLRGMSLKALYHNNWNINSAIQLITGPNLNGKTSEIINKRIEGYIKNILVKRKTEQEKSLYTNLPKEYHQFLESAINLLR